MFSGTDDTGFGTNIGTGGFAATVGVGRGGAAG